MQYVLIIVATILISAVIFIPVGVLIRKKIMNTYVKWESYIADICKKFQVLYIINEKCSWKNSKMDRKNN